MFLSTIFVVAALFAQKGEIPDKYLLPAPASDKVVARVDGVSIKASEVEALLWEWRGQEALADLISFRMMKNAAEKMKITVSDVDVQKELDTQISQISPAATGGKPVDVYLLEQGFTKSRLWLRIKTELLLNKMASKDFAAADYVKVSTIVVRPESTSTAAMAAAAKKADVFYDMLNKGESWDKVLRLSTIDERTVESKGLVGWRRIEAFPFEIQQEFLKAKAGGFTKPKQTNNGFQIFRLEMLGKDAKDQDLADAETIHIQSTKPTIASKIRTESKVERFLQNSGGGQP